VSRKARCVRSIERSSDVAASFPHAFFELSDQEVSEYFKPSDLMVGKTVHIYGRPFFIYDCDLFTKSFYAKNFGVTHFDTVPMTESRDEYPKMVMQRVYCLFLYTIV
jgi:EF-hand domain-containing protein 1